MTAKRWCDTCKDYTSHCGHAVGKSAVERVVMPGTKRQFEKDLFDLINDHVARGLSKQHLVEAMKWATGNCEFS